MAFLSRLKHAWNVFKDKGNQTEDDFSGGGSISYGARPPDRNRVRFSTERTMLASILNRISLDVAAVDIRHVRTDRDGRYVEDMVSGLNTCLTFEANVDQASRAFKQDAALTLFDKGTIAIVPVDASINPAVSGSFEVKTLRVGTIVSWRPRHVQVNLYNDAPDKGYRENVWLDKKFVGIVENPLYLVMNEPNSTLQRLIRKLALLDAVDDASSSGRLDVIIQLPYVVKTETKRQQADQRIKDIEFQLKGSKYGVAYVDGTEKITQLNRPAENNLLKQIEYLMDLLYSQLGITPDIMNGTADEATMVNYNSRTIEPIVTALVEAMRRAFLTKTALSQGQNIMAFRDPFKFLSMKDIAEIADKFSRNLIAVPNDIRTAIGWKPSKDPKADELKNNNMPDPTPAPSEPNSKQPAELGGNSQNGSS